MIDDHKQQFKKKRKEKKERKKILDQCGYNGKRIE